MKIIASSPDFKPEIYVALQAARAAGCSIMGIYAKTYAVHERYGEPVTQADTASNKIITHMLSSSSYAYPILSEESEDDPKRLQSKRIWIIDPLDGTSDFVNMTGEFTVLVGLVEDHQPIMGIVYRPIDDTAYVAEQGCGAYMQDGNRWRSISVSNIKDFASARVIMSRHHRSKDEEHFLQRFGIHKFMECGSCGLKVATIAEGKAEFYMTMTNKIKQWDTCAANCIIKEAGGTMTDMQGNALSYNTSDVYHQNGILVDNGKYAKRIIDQAVLHAMDQ